MNPILFPLYFNDLESDLSNHECEAVIPKSEKHNDDIDIALHFSCLLYQAMP